MGSHTDFKVKKSFSPAKTGEKLKNHSWMRTTTGSHESLTPNSRSLVSSITFYHERLRNYVGNLCWQFQLIFVDHCSNFANDRDHGAFQIRLFNQIGNLAQRTCDHTLIRQSCVFNASCWGVGRKNRVQSKLLKVGTNSCDPLKSRPCPFWPKRQNRHHS